MLFGTSYIYHSVRGVFTSVRKITFWIPKPVYINVIGRESKTSTNAIATDHACTVSESTNQHEIRVKRETVIHKTLESPVLVLSRATCRKSEALKLLTRGVKQVIVVRGTANILPFVPYPVIVTSFLSKLARLPENMVIKRGRELSMLRQQPSGRAEPENEEVQANAVYKPSESKQLQIRTH